MKRRPFCTIDATLARPLQDPHKTPTRGLYRIMTELLQESHQHCAEFVYQRGNGTKNTLSRVGAWFAEEFLMLYWKLFSVLTMKILLNVDVSIWAHTYSFMTAFLTFFSFSLSLSWLCPSFKRVGFIDIEGAHQGKGQQRRRKRGLMNWEKDELIFCLKYLDSSFSISASFVFCLDSRDSKRTNIKEGATEGTTESTTEGAREGESEIAKAKNVFWAFFGLGRE